MTTQQQLHLNLFREGLSMREAGYGENRIWDFLNTELQNDYLTDKIFDLVLRTKILNKIGRLNPPTNPSLYSLIPHYYIFIL